MSDLPTVAELDAYVGANPRATVWETVQHFGQTGEHVAYTPKGTVWAFGTTAPFAAHLAEYLRQPHVDAKTDAVLVAVADDALYAGPEKYLPIVLSLARGGAGSFI